jgi:hypothetical protein
VDAALHEVVRKTEQLRANSGWLKHDEPRRHVVAAASMASVPKAVTPLKEPVRAPSNKVPTPSTPSKAPVGTSLHKVQPGSAESRRLAQELIGCAACGAVIHIHIRAHCLNRAATRLIRS